jgi:Rieske 2Fe-2S family protein
MDMRHLRSEQTRQPITSASHVPGAIYASDEVLQLEKQNIFMKEWLCVARVEEVENPGDFFTTRIIGEPVLLVRNAQGQVNAFANICLHRGVEIATGTGNTKQFSCPYHAWAYDLDGHLTSASFMRESKDFDPKTCRLKTIHSAVWAGWVFINFSPNPVPFQEAASEFMADVDLL